LISDRHLGYRRCRNDKTLRHPARSNRNGLIYTWYRHLYGWTPCLLLPRDPAEHGKQNGIPAISCLKALPERPNAMNDVLEDIVLIKAFAGKG
jgi:hypothetical protein